MPLISRVLICGELCALSPSLTLLTLALAKALVDPRFTPTMKPEITSLLIPLESRANLLSLSGSVVVFKVSWGV